MLSVKPQRVATPKRLIAGDFVATTLSGSWSAKSAGGWISRLFELLILLILLAFLTEYSTATLGMGYGTLLAPLLLMLGYTPFVLVPVVLLSQFLAGSVSGAFHHLLRNINLAEEPSERTSIVVFSVTGVIGVVFAAFTSSALPEWFVKLYIALVVALMGVVILVDRREESEFSIRRLGLLGLFGAFNKGISGGGYGPIVTVGQILSGIPPKAAVAITALVEAFMCAVGFVLYYLLSGSLDITLSLGIVLGAVGAAPLSAITTSRVASPALRKAIASSTILLGVITALLVLFAM
jgi:uncharacterized membrane protein YfcA